MRHVWTWGIKGHPWRRASSDGAQGICWREGDVEGKKEEERHEGREKRRDGKSTEGEKGRERRKMDACGGVGIIEYHLWGLPTYQVFPTRLPLRSDQDYLTTILSGVSDVLPYFTEEETEA